VIVVSDLTGTLTTGWPVIGLTKWARKKQSALRANFYLGRAAPSFFLAKWGILDMQKLGQKLLFSALSLIKHPSQRILDEMGEYSVDSELWPKRRQDVLERLTTHIADGAQVFVASSIYEPTVLAFANRIEAQGIGTPLEIVDGQVRFAESLVADEKKAEKVLSKLGVEKVDVAYGDTWADIPLLEHANRPVAVYPDRVLKSTALERGWEILGSRNGK
jgi:phosphoserine phosphatase